MLYKGCDVSTPDKPLEPGALSIGALANATGVPVDTLRTWERRYGFPAPLARTGGSHRRYGADAIERVGLIVRALALGHRASAVVGRPPEELHALLAAAEPERRPAATNGDDRRAIARWLEHTRGMQGDALLGDFRRALADMPALEFLTRRMGPYLSAMGEAWASGALRVSQEHFASERVREFLNAEWRALSSVARGVQPSVVLATPPGEQHALGLHMAAWVVALAGARVIFLGAGTPMEELAFAAERHGATGAVLSVAAGYAGPLRAQLDELVRRLPQVSVVAGGEGCSGLPPELVLNGFEDLFAWARRLPASRRETPE